MLVVVFVDRPLTPYQTILGTAIPKITDEFHDLNKVAWYGSAYFMTFGGTAAPIAQGICLLRTNVS